MTKRVPAISLLALAAWSWGAAAQGGVTLLSPLNNQTAALPFTVNAQTTSDVSWVNFYLDGKHLRSSPPLSFLVDPAPIVPGPHRVSATAYGRSGAVLNSASATIFVGDSSNLISLRATAIGSTTATVRNRITIASPPGSSPGDLLLAQIAVRGGSGVQVTAPAGWTLWRRVNSGTTLAQFLYARWAPASSSTPAAYTWQFNSTSDGAGGIAAYHGVNYFGPMDGLASQDNGVSAILTAPSVTLPPAHTSDYLVAFFAIANNTAITRPPAMVARWSFPAASGGIGIAMADQRSAIDGPSGAMSATSGAAAANVGFLLVLTQRFLNLRPGGLMPTGAQCTGAVRYWPWEPRTDNNAANLSIPTAAQLQALYNSSVNGGVPVSAFYRVDGKFTGTTDEIIQWGACKWGFDEDLVRAIALNESYWHQNARGDYTQTSSRCPSGTWNGTGCYQTYGLLQIKYPSYPATWPMSRNDTAFAVDYKLAYQRACMNGQITHIAQAGVGYPTSDPTRMLWGCVGQWFSGGWYDAGAVSYIAQIKQSMSDKLWQIWGF